MPIVNETLQRYIEAIDTGFGLIGGEVRWVFNTLVLINIVVAALFWALSEDRMLVPLLRKIIYIGMFAWIIENWVEITNAIAQTFMMLGIQAGGGHVPQDVLLNPAAIADQARVVIIPMMDAVRDLCGPIAFFENFAEIGLLSLAIVAVIVAFFAVAIQVVLAILYFKLGTLAAFVLIPFSLITHTAFMAERPLGWVVAAGIRLMLLTLVVGLGQSILGNIQWTPGQDTMRAALDVSIGAILFMVLALTASRLATDLAAGTPRLGALDAGAAAVSPAIVSAYTLRQGDLTARSLARKSASVAKAASAIRGKAPAMGAKNNTKPENTTQGDK